MIQRKRIEPAAAVNEHSNRKWAGARRQAQLAKLQRAIAIGKAMIGSIARQGLNLAPRYVQGFWHMTLRFPVQRYDKSTQLLKNSRNNINELNMDSDNLDEPLA